jgi:hypothetical protein
MKERPRVQGDMFMSLMPGNEGMDIMLSREKRKHVTAAETGLTNCSKVHSGRLAICAQSGHFSQSRGKFLFLLLRGFSWHSQPWR